MRCGWVSCEMWMVSCDVWIDLCGVWIDSCDVWMHRQLGLSCWKDGVPVWDDVSLFVSGVDGYRI